MTSICDSFKFNEILKYKSIKNRHDLNAENYEINANNRNKEDLNKLKSILFYELEYLLQYRSQVIPN